MIFGIYIVSFRAFLCRFSAISAKAAESADCFHSARNSISFFVLEHNKTVVKCRTCAGVRTETVRHGVAVSIYEIQETVLSGIFDPTNIDSVFRCNYARGAGYPFLLLKSLTPTKFGGNGKWWTSVGRAETGADKGMISCQTMTRKRSYSVVRFVVSNRRWMVSVT